MDTDMTEGMPGDKASPGDVALMTLTALESGQSELLADDITRQIHAGLTAAPSAYLGVPE
ncbi:hypothetical protein ORN12_08580 [Pantoea vagans]|uniref:hypothetical protein n=1 Tax=Pantoea vagans TaxID=470934 RepID=UPI00225409F8|nr:hypothetical protein [Pantoea vagans]MCX3309054.1 hypothetical protein [Pantoea vagans]